MLPVVRGLSCVDRGDIDSIMIRYVRVPCEQRNLSEKERGGEELIEQSTFNLFLHGIGWRYAIVKT